MGSVIIIPNFFPSDNLGTVTLKNEVAVKSISIVGSASVTGRIAKYAISYSPLITTQREVTWSIESGSEYAVINSSTGTLTVLEGANSSPVTIKAVSTANQSVVAMKSITVTHVPNVSLVYSQVNEQLIDYKTVDFDVIAEEEWMIMAYRDDGSYAGSSKPDFYSDGGGFAVYGLSLNPFNVTSAKTASATSKTNVIKLTDGIPKVFAMKKVFSKYYYTLDGSAWVEFASYYYKDNSSTTFKVGMGRTDFFTGEVYGLYLYRGVSDSQVSDFFALHNA